MADRVMSVHDGVVTGTVWYALYRALDEWAPPDIVQGALGTLAIDPGMDVATLHRRLLYGEWADTYEPLDQGPGPHGPHMGDAL
jgi:hypothetical protein